MGFTDPGVLLKRYATKIMECPWIRNPHTHASIVMMFLMGMMAGDGYTLCGGFGKRKVPSIFP